MSKSSDNPIDPLAGSLTIPYGIKLFPEFVGMQKNVFSQIAWTN